MGHRDESYEEIRQRIEDSSIYTLNLLKLRMELS